jgi:dsRNA-specific ribonuclease
MPSDAIDLCAHLSALGIECEHTKAGNVSVRNPGALLRHLTSESFTAVEPWERFAAARPSPYPVPAHRTDNPVGALQEWCQRRGPNHRLPVYISSENVGTIHAPRFTCTVQCDGLSETAEDANKAIAKRKAALAILGSLGTKHGREKAQP